MNIWFIVNNNKKNNNKVEYKTKALMLKFYQIILSNSFNLLK